MGEDIETAGHRSRRPEEDRKFTREPGHGRIVYQGQREELVLHIGLLPHPDAHNLPIIAVDDIHGVLSYISLFLYVKL